MTVRRATSADAPALERLQSFLRESNPGLLAVSLDSPATTVLVSVDADEPVGYLLALPGESAAGAFVAELAVHPAHRREGRATALLEALVARVDGPVSLTVDPGNEAAQSLYRTLGFERVGRREAYYDDGRAALVFVREP